MDRESLQTLDELIEELEGTGRTTANHFAHLVSELGGKPKTLDRIIVANRDDQRGITHTVMCYIIALLIKKIGEN